jgi:hypothetical protein
VGEEREAVRIDPSELVEIEGPPEIRRRQAFAKPVCGPGSPRRSPAW